MMSYYIKSYFKKYYFYNYKPFIIIAFIFQFKKNKLHHQERMQIPMYPIQQAPKMIDVCYYSCIKKIQSTSKFIMGFYIFRESIVMYYIIKHFLISETTDVTVYNLITLLFFIFSISNIATFVFSNWTYRKILTNNSIITQIADRIDHSRVNQINYSQQNLQFYSPSQNSQLKVSRRIYQFENNIQITDIDQQYRQRAERNCSALITMQIDSDKRYKFWNNFFNLCSVGIFVYSIIVLSKGTVNTPEFCFILTYLFTEVCTRLFIYIILLIIGLSPLCCLGICIYSCFFKKQQKIQLPQAQQATLNIIKECQGQCPICVQNLNQNEKIIVLKCSPKHVYHQLCIKGWSQVGNTCPVCRALL